MYTHLLFLYLYSFILTVTGFSISRVDPVGGSCILDVNNDLPRNNEPLLVERSQASDSLEFVFPETEGRRGIIALREGQQILITCPGNRNFINETRDNVGTAVCVSDTLLTIDGQKFQSRALDCNTRAQASALVTTRRCANNRGTIVELGFHIPQWLKMMEVCHNIELSSTYYTRHSILGDRIAGKVIRPSGTRPNFIVGDRRLYQGFNPEQAYTQRHQRTVLTAELGARRASEILDTTFLARGHLAPDADFLFSPHQFLTYFFVNAAPQWQTANAGNWLRVEDNARRIARRLGADLDVLTGTLGVLTLEGERGPREIRLQGSRLPVPEFFWKVLRNTQDNSCIAFVASNNPFAAGRPRMICPDICAQTGWPVLQNETLRGFVYCCEFSELRRAIPDIPSTTCRSVLRGPP